MNSNIRRKAQATFERSTLVAGLLALDNSLRFGNNINSDKRTNQRTFPLVFLFLFVKKNTGIGKNTASTVRIIFRYAIIFLCAMNLDYFNTVGV
jgi:hypothetical protein